MRPPHRLSLALPGMVPRVSATGEQEFSYPRLERIAVQDAPITLATGWVAVAFVTLTGARTVTLPPSAALDPETVILIQDEAGAAGSHTITASVPGSGAGSNDLINGAGTATITSNYGVLRLRTNGSGGWFLI